ncbi:MAG: hypothetical protein AAGC57_15750 [Pseudomonadota bacterium]
MSGRPLLLQAFDHSEGPEAVDPALDAAQPPTHRDETEAAPEQTQDLPSPVDAAALADHRATDRIDRLLNRLDELALAGPAALETEHRRHAEAFARAAASALPSLIETGFAAEVAAASLEIARASRPRDIALHLAPEDLEAVQLVLDRQSEDRGDIDLPLRLVSDPRVAPGEAALRWTGGGAEIDANTLAAKALACLDRALMPATAGVGTAHETA